VSRRRDETVTVSVYTYDGQSEVYLEHDPELRPGTWRNARRRSGEASAEIACPICGTAISLAWEGQHEPEILRHGVVAPGVSCRGASCAWHEYVRLVGWVDESD
jgi:hypothetical protein